jgi:hypothetical protein
MYSKYNTPTKFNANIGLPQFVAQCSKTKNAMNFIKDQNEAVNEIELFYDFFSNRNVEVGHHRIAIVFTNNSLAENTMWKVRANTDLGHLNVLTLSSSTSSDCKGLKDIQELLISIKDINKLPHIIIMCSNGKRVEDMITLIQRFETQIRLHPSVGNILPFFDVIFDEADKNLGIIGNFLTSSIVRIAENNSGGSLSSVMFITATAFDAFWRMLSEHNIYNLDRTWLNERLMEAASLEGYDNFKDYYNYLLSQYRQISNHKHNLLENKTQNPKEYAEFVFEELVKYKNEKLTPITVYAPAKTDIKSHLDMTSFFLSKNYAVLIHNGQYKEFRFPNEKTITVEEFSNKYKINGELRDLLVKFREIYPHLDFAITGNKTIERGITFNTLGFNFTHAIISSYHANDLATLLQMLGRTNGDIKYVNIITIICPKKIIDDVNITIKRINKVMESKPEILSSDDFNKINDSEYLCKQVPLICPLTVAEYNMLSTKIKGRFNRELIINFLKPKYPWINESEYNSETLLQISEVKTNELTDKATKKTKQSSYEKHILSGINKSERGERGIIDMKFKNDQDKKKCWNIFIDGFNSQNHLLVIYRWDGTQKIIK